MGESSQFWVFRVDDPSAYREAMQRAAQDAGSLITWDDDGVASDLDFRLLERPRVSAHYLPYLGGSEFVLARLAGARLGAAWLNVRMQEGDHWDYTFFRGPTPEFSFSTRATYWGNEPCTDDEARLATRRLADAWEIAASDIDRFHRPWDGESAPSHGELAYPDDAAPHGSVFQIFDFLRALGTDDAANIEADARRHSVRPLNEDGLIAAMHAICPPDPPPPRPPKKRRRLGWRSRRD